jgi:hypothetical protein
MACPGDSGGPVGHWHGGYFLEKAVISANTGYCGSRFYSARLKYTLSWVEFCLNGEGMYCFNYAAAGYPYKSCW